MLLALFSAGYEMSPRETRMEFNPDFFRGTLFVALVASSVALIFFRLWLGNILPERYGVNIGVNIIMLGAAALIIALALIVLAVFRRNVYDFAGFDQALFWALACGAFSIGLFIWGIGRINNLIKS